MSARAGENTSDRAVRERKTVSLKAPARSIFYNSGHPELGHSKPDVHPGTRLMAPEGTVIPEG